VGVSLKTAKRGRRIERMQSPVHRLIPLCAPGGNLSARESSVMTGYGECGVLIIPQIEPCTKNFRAMELSHPSRKNKNAARMGHPILILIPQIEPCTKNFRAMELSHPSRKNKNAARMGHPILILIPQIEPCTKNFRAMELSHPSRKNKNAARVGHPGYSGLDFETGESLLFLAYYCFSAAGCFGIGMVMSIDCTGPSFNSSNGGLISGPLPTTSTASLSG